MSEMGISARLASSEAWSLLTRISLLISSGVSEKASPAVGGQHREQFVWTEQRSLNSLTLPENSHPPLVGTARSANSIPRAPRVSATHRGKLSDRFQCCS